MARGRPYRCIWCGSNNTVSKGVRRNRLIGLRHIRRCRSCGRKFTPRHQKPMAQSSPAPPVSRDSGNL